MFVNLINLAELKKKGRGPNPKTRFPGRREGVKTRAAGATKIQKHSFNFVFNRFIVALQAGTWVSFCGAGQ